MSSRTRVVDVPVAGCLGLLAAGADGLRAWRLRRAQEGDTRLPTPPETSAPKPPSTSGRKKLLLVGWDAADWKVINPLIDAGLMPTLEGLIDRGVMGNLSTLDPPLSPMLWTSIATGMTADQHGILGFVEPSPDGSRVRPSLVTSRKVKAIWNILNQRGYNSHVVGWWPSHPAEPVNGVSVSNLFHRVAKPIEDGWPMAEASVHPVSIRDTIASLRVHPEELTAEHLVPFVPKAAEIDQKKDRRLSAIAKILAEAGSMQAVATWIMKTQPWDMLAVYFDAIDHLGHGFMSFHPPQRPGIPSELFDRYQGVIAAGYRFHDMLLEHLLALTDEDTYVVLVSDHGFHPDHLRPMAIPKEPAGPAAEHREHGVICIRGPGVAKDELVYGASVLDVAPTVLMLLGESIGRDMRGKPLVEAMLEPPQLEYVDSWDSIEGPAGLHQETSRRDPWAEVEALHQLVELGYIEPPEENAAANVERVQRESRFYLARALIHQNRSSEALPLLEELVVAAPDQLRYGLFLAGCYRDLGRVAELRATVEQLSEEFDRQELEAKKKREAQREAANEKTGKPAAKHPWHPPLELLRGQLLLAEGDAAAALFHLQRAELAIRRSPDLHITIGNVYLQLEKWDDAARAFSRALEIDDDSAPAHHGLAIAHLRRRRIRRAAGEALQAVSLRYRYPTAHYHLGEALAALGKTERAVEAFEVCLTQAPGIMPARRRLIEIYRRSGETGRAEEHENVLAAFEVSGNETPGADSGSANDELGAAGA